MNDLDYNSLLPFIAVSGYLLLLIAALVRHRQRPTLTRWFWAFLMLSILWEFMLIFGSDANQLASQSIQLLLSSTILLGVMTAVFAGWTRIKEWLLIGSAFLLLALIINLVGGSQGFGLPGASSIRATYGSLFSHLAWLILNSYLVIHTWQDFHDSPFSWHANRLLFWLLALLTNMIGEALTFFHWTGLTFAGQILRFLAVFGIAYAIASHRIIDVRTRFQRLLAMLIITLVSGLPLAAAIATIQWLAREQSTTSIILLTLVTVALGILIYDPYRRSVERIAFSYLPGQGIMTGKVVRDYSQAVYQTLDVNQLAMVIADTLGQLLKTERITLTLVSDTHDGLELKPVGRPGQAPSRALKLSSSAPLIHTLLQHQPLLQYEIDFNPEYANINPQERAWLQDMAMEVYVPIIAGEALTGLIAIGPTKAGIPYQPSELELAQILADQTVVALQNSRLYSELASNNEKIRSLNVDLTKHNERLEIIDRVKSDFIAIASHELRTPLTQVKGYADILATMNEENTLTLEQTREIVDHIGQASDRLDTLISAMLDTSELDVDEMQLTFAQVEISEVIREAVRPFQPAIRQRRLTFGARGLDILPTIEADQKRLVQAFSNLIGNAIKYTPDDGNVNIQAMAIPSQEARGDFVEVIIADKGIGIDPKFHELIFEKFFRVGDPQLHSTSETKFKGAGPGLGLPIAKGVVEAHGGRIWVESEAEDEHRLPGSRFHIILPVQQTASTPY